MLTETDRIYYSIAQRWVCHARFKAVCSWLLDAKADWSARPWRPLSPYVRHEMKGY